MEYGKNCVEREWTANIDSERNSQLNVLRAAQVEYLRYDERHFPHTHSLNTLLFLHSTDVNNLVIKKHFCIT